MIMLLSNIKLIKGIERDRSHYSFVGIQRNKVNEELEFWLPLGFEDFPEDFINLKSFFFKMYRTFSVYIKRKEYEKLIQNQGISKSKDGFYESVNGFGFSNEDKNEIVLYSKINALDKIIEGYDELRIGSLEKKQVKSNDIDYSKIHLYLHKSFFLEDDVVYLDDMNISKNMIIQQSPPLVQLFCFIYTEIKEELEELATIPLKAFELAENFKEVFLNTGTKLFESEETLNATICTLKEILNDIDLFTIYKDEDYWHFYNAVEAFLYSEKNDNEDDIYWGMNNFYDVWEDMCQFYALNNYPYSELKWYADIRGVLKSYKRSTINPFELTLNKEVAKRTLRPDLVLLTTVSTEKVKRNLYSVLPKFNRITKEKTFKVKFNDYSYIKSIHPKIRNYYLNLLTKIKQEDGRMVHYLTEESLHKFNDLVESYLLSSVIPITDIKDLMDKNSEVYIIDYKYLSEGSFHEYNEFSIDEDGNNKIKEDIKKQLVYEWSIQNNFNKVKTKSEFWIPSFTDSLSFETCKKYIEISNCKFNESQIKVVKINFNIVQNFYIKKGIYV
ncbi:hypothetical protein AAE02nite_46860 [Adhaeribacter aerolatus]|uniref:Uncharacterized protein n=2 Tax=Adhaeribacter aerolatus TaxID=670289 RepID=A0A512B4Y5_9BACT|nr:hypothetical protein AAE02nite_46860 [Adhaeribacter aerolatus]